jgi:hypothetical protein
VAGLAERSLDVGEVDQIVHRPSPHFHELYLRLAGFRIRPMVDAAAETRAVTTISN